MAKANVKPASIHTHEGAKAQQINAEQQLRRSVMSCLLWEKQFYEEGENIAVRIAKTIPQVSAEKVAGIAVEAREKMKLRHMPLFIVREMARLKTHRHLVAATLERVVQRADELSEFVALYWKDGRQPLSAQVKKGLAAAFGKFSEYALAKYNRDGAVKLRDVLFLSHAKPKDDEQAALWKRLIAGELAVPDTWEVISSNIGTLPGMTEMEKQKARKEAWERLIIEGKLGGLALLRNLRNMKEAGVSEKIIFAGLNNMRTERILPFRFISAAKYVPQWETQIEPVMLKCLEGKDKLPGKTVLIADVSGSMYGATISGKSELNRAEVACTLAVLVREMCEYPIIYATAGNDYTRIHQTQLVPPRRGFALKDAIYQMCRPLGGGGIFLKQVLDYVKIQESTADRIIVITDEQDCGIEESDSPLKAKPFGKHNYLVNVASYQNGIGYGPWTHIDGWSEAVLDYILACEIEGKTAEEAAR